MSGREGARRGCKEREHERKRLRERLWVREGARERGHKRVRLWESKREEGVVCDEKVLCVVI